MWWCCWDSLWSIRYPPAWLGTPERRLFLFEVIFWDIVLDVHLEHQFFFKSTRDIFKNPILRTSNCLFLSTRSLSSFFWGSLLVDLFISFYFMASARQRFGPKMEDICSPRSCVQLLAWLFMAAGLNVLPHHWHFSRTSKKSATSCGETSHTCPTKAHLGHSCCTSPKPNIQKCFI